MDKFIYNLIVNNSKKNIETPQIISKAEEHFGSEGFEIKGGYRELVSVINDFCLKDILSPVKASKTNGRNPALYNKYRIILKKDDDKEDFNRLLNELKSIHPKLDKDFYHRNPNIYKDDREYVLMISKYLLDELKSCSLNYRCTMNERSFEIFNDEKFLDGKGKVILKRLGISMEDLNCYKTLEAFFYILFEPKERINILIIENKDTFFSVLKYLERREDKSLYDTTIDMLIYGEGKKIVNSFKFINEVARGVAIDKVYYFGDLDFEGIGIFNSLAHKYGKHLIIPHVELYKQLLCVAKNPPVLKSCQTEIFMELFLMYFDDRCKKEITGILYNNRYIPQEALNFGRKKSL
ncbi:UNVERIFIED_CONTAM: uncharacterized protein DUF2220 [Acetivibrio alkalicellulosi]